MQNDSVDNCRLRRHSTAHKTHARAHTLLAVRHSSALLSPSLFCVSCATRRRHRCSVLLLSPTSALTSCCTSRDNHTSPGAAERLRLHRTMIRSGAAADRRPIRVAAAVAVQPERRSLRYHAGQICRQPEAVCECEHGNILKIGAV